MCHATQKRQKSPSGLSFFSSRRFFLLHILLHFFAASNSVPRTATKRRDGKVCLHACWTWMGHERGGEGDASRRATTHICKTIKQRMSSDTYVRTTEAHTCANARFPGCSGKFLSFLAFCGRRRKKVYWPWPQAQEEEKKVTDRTYKREPLEICTQRMSCWGQSEVISTVYDVHLGIFCLRMLILILWAALTFVSDFFILSKAL